MNDISSAAQKSRFARTKNPSNTYFAALDGYRGSLSLVVAAYHTIWLSNINQTAFLNNGPVIIDLFFALSGFLMFYLYKDKIVDFGSTLTFMKRRFARLYPLHLFTLLLLVLYSVLRIFLHSNGIAEQEVGEILPFHEGALDGWGTLASNVFLLHSLGFHDGLTFNAPSWTISVEFFTYAVFAVLILFLKPKTFWHYVVLTGVSFLIYAGLSTQKPDMNITHDYGALRCIAGFTLGGVAAFAHRKIKNIVETWSLPKLTVIECITVLIGASFVIYCPGKLQFFVGPIILGFILVFSFDGGLISRLLSARPFRYLAKISYSIYMTHFMIAIAFNIFAERIAPKFLGVEWNATGLGGDILLLPYLFVVILVSHFTYKIVEVKGGRLISKLTLSKPSTSCVAGKIGLPAGHEQRYKSKN